MLRSGLSGAIGFLAVQLIANLVLTDAPWNWAYVGTPTAHTEPMPAADESWSDRLSFLGAYWRPLSDQK